MNRDVILLIIILVSFISCSKDKIEINHPPLANFEIIDRIDKYYFKSTAIDVDDDMISYEWILKPEILLINNPNDAISYIELPATPEPLEVNISHVVFDGLNYDTISKDIQLPLLTKNRKWGLGCQLEKELSNNVDYNWYIDQMNTGIFWENNCGPATVTMAIKWYDQKFTGTTEDARGTYQSAGVWWTTHDIVKYLNKYSVNNYIIELDGVDSLVDEINRGNIIIVCLDMFYIRESSCEVWHIDKFFTTNNVGAGHFIVIKGYKIVDNHILFEIYDPGSYGSRYVDSSLKGKDRYYRSDDIDNATNKWWDYAIIVSKVNLKSSKSLNPNKIYHRYGF